MLEALSHNIYLKRCSAKELSLGILSLGLFAEDLSFWICRLGPFVWDISFEIFRFVCSTRDLSLGPHRSLGEPGGEDFQGSQWEQWAVIILNLLNKNPSRQVLLGSTGSNRLMTLTTFIDSHVSLIHQQAQVAAGASGSITQP